MKKNKDARIVIIGAGAAGLTAAESLREKGYTDIRILEKESFAGGKCRTEYYDGRNYEMGAGIIASNHQTVMALVEKYRVPLAPLVFERNNLYDTEKGSLGEDIFSLPEKFILFWQLVLRYNRLLRQFPGVQYPGFARTEPELADNFHHWAASHRLHLVERNFERYFTGFGYGYWEEIPAAYTLKYNDWDTLVSYFRRKIYYFPEGIQRLWQTIAGQHQVDYNCLIQRIKRNDTGIVIDTMNEQMHADVLLLTCPLDESLNFMDAGAVEKELFSKILYTDYRTYVCRLENFPNQTGFIPDNFSPDKKGHPVFWYKRYPDSDIYTVYVLSDFSVPDEAILQNLKQTVEKLGGVLVAVEKMIKWKYFPHVDTRELQNGYYTKIEAIQGENNTYYAGELMNFSSMELTAAYAKDLVQRFF